MHPIRIICMHSSQKVDSSFCIFYQTASTEFGNCLIAFHNDDLVHLSFFDTSEPLDAIIELRKKWSGAMVRRNPIPRKIPYELKDMNITSIVLRGSEYQMKIWKALTMNTKPGDLIAYSTLGSGRSVARVMASNTIGYFVPCHRVIGKNKELTGYKWGGTMRKQAILKTEAPTTTNIDNLFQFEYTTQIHCESIH